MLDLNHFPHRDWLARLVLGRLPGAESLTPSSALVISKSEGTPARWTGLAAPRLDLEEILTSVVRDAARKERLRQVAQRVLDELASHTALVPVLFLVDDDGIMVLDLWPPSQIAAARGLS